jgi:hypothetical protein
MPSNIEMAEYIQAAFKRGFLEGMQAPTKFFADRIEVHYMPPRSTDGWFEGQRLRDYQPVEAAVFKEVLPDAHHVDVKIITRAEDQIITVMTLAGHLTDGSAFSCPVTMVYNVRDGAIVRVVPVYDKEGLQPFEEAFARAAKTSDIPVETAARLKAS